MNHKLWNEFIELSERSEIGSADWDWIPIYILVVSQNFCSSQLSPNVEQTRNCPLDNVQTILRNAKKPKLPKQQHFLFEHYASPSNEGCSFDVYNQLCSWLLEFWILI